MVAFSPAIRLWLGKSWVIAAASISAKGRLGNLALLGYSIVSNVVADLVADVATDLVTDVTDGAADLVTDVTDVATDVTDVTDGAADVVTDVTDVATDFVADVTDVATDFVTDVADVTDELFPVGNIFGGMIVDGLFFVTPSVTSVIPSVAKLPPDKLIPICTLGK